MIPVGDFLPDALATLLSKAPLTPEKVAFAWRQAVGPALDRVSSVELAGDRLVVQVKSAQWKRELARSTPLIRGRLAALLGPDTVRQIDIVAPASAKRGRTP